jgi:diketogulonate reductase-like aldo/keto reductase
MGKDCREENKDVWRAMEGFLADGRVKAIGVSNFTRADLESLLPACMVIPSVDQIQWYIGYDVADTVAACAEHGIVVEAYSPFAHGRIVNHPDIVDMGRRYEVSAPQLSIRYLLQKGAVPLPKATSADHIRANAEVDFEISDVDMAILDAMRDTESHPGAVSFRWS